MWWRRWRSRPFLPDRPLPLGREPTPSRSVRPFCLCVNPIGIVFCSFYSSAWASATRPSEHSPWTRSRSPPHPIRPDCSALPLKDPVRASERGRGDGLREGQHVTTLCHGWGGSEFVDTISRDRIPRHRPKCTGIVSVPDAPPCRWVVWPSRSLAVVTNPTNPSVCLSFTVRWGAACVAPPRDHWFKQHCRRAGVSGSHTTIHQFRHFLVSTLLQNTQVVWDPFQKTGWVLGLPVSCTRPGAKANRLADVSQFIGHRSIATTVHPYWHTDALT